MGELVVALEAEEVADVPDAGLAVLEQCLKLRDAQVALLFEAIVDLLGLGLLRSDSKLFLMHLIEFPLLLNLLGQALLIFTEVVNLLIEFIDILVNEVILLLVLQEDVGDLLEVVGAAFLFDLFEALPDGSH